MVFLSSVYRVLPCFFVFIFFSCVFCGGRSHARPVCLSGGRYLRLPGRDVGGDGPPVLLIGPLGGSEGAGHQAKRRDGWHQGIDR